MLVLPLAVLQTIWGLGLLAIFCGNVLNRMTWPERLGIAILLGLITQTYVHLVIMLVLTHDFQRIYVLLLACAAIPFALSGVLRRRISVKTPRLPDLFPNPAIKLFAGVGIVALISWVVVAALSLPTSDYDANAIWTYRDMVLLTEHTIFTPSLMDPLRFNPMPHHPYLVPIMETSYTMATRGFNYAAIHVPYVLFYLGYLGLVYGAAKAIAGSWRGGAIVASLALLPAMAVQQLMLSGREPYMAVMGFGAVYYLARWLEEPDGAWLALSVCFATAIQQTKVEGDPFLAGYILGILIFCALKKGEFQIRKRQLAWAALAIIVIVFPWATVSRMIPKSNHDYTFTNGILANVQPWKILLATPFALYLIFSELFLRPELFGLAPLAMVLGFGKGWNRNNTAARLTVLAAPVICLLSLLGLYAVRQTQGELLRNLNVTLSRRVLVVVPALMYACLYLPLRKQPAD